MPTPHFRLWRLLTLCVFVLSFAAVAVLSTKAELLPSSLTRSDAAAKSSGASSPATSASTTLTPAWNGYDKIVYGGSGALYLINPDGSGKTFLTGGNFPSWSPDGTKIAFIADAPDPLFYLFVINADGTGRRQLTSLPFADNYDEFISWSPDSQKILWTSQDQEGGDAQEIYVVNADGSGSVRITTNSVRDTWPQWSPDGQKIVFMSVEQPLQGRTDIYTMNPDGSNRTRLTYFATDAAAQFPKWSPDGSKIVFTVWSCCSLVPPRRNELWTMDATGGNQTQIGRFATTPSEVSDLVWSHDSSQIGVRARFNPNFAGDYIVNADGGSPVLLTTGSLLHDWSPDDSLIVYTGGDPYVSGDLYIATEDGARTKIDFLPNGISRFGRPMWRPRPPCNCTAIARPTPQFIQSNWPDPENKINWTMSAEVTDRDGLVLTNVKLGPRKLAEKISVPYYNLNTTTYSARGELKPDNIEADGTRRSRLIDYQVTQDSERLVVEANYAIDQIPSGSASCVYVTQRYEFYHEGVGGPCEPSEELKCSRFKPIVKYRFFGSQGQKLTSFTIPQRRHFTIDDNINNSIGLFKDCDNAPPPFGLGCRFNGIIFERKENPLFEEWYGRVIESGASNNVWDNIHQTQFDSIDEPGPHYTEQGFSLKSGGCPECMHNHWRWTAFAGKPWGEGKVFGLPPGSKQNFEFAVVKNNPGEEHPDNFVDLANYERIRHPATGYDPPRQVYDYSAPDDVVVWYSGTGVQNRDSFFGFGIFFNPSIKNQFLSTSGEGFTSGQPSLNPPGSDGISAILVSNLFEEGPTEVTQFDSTIMGTLPANYVVYNGLSFDVKTEAEISGPNTVTFTLPSVSDPNLFNNLRIFHAEQDPFDPDQVLWVDRTILPPDSPAPDFLNRTISARTRLLGPFLVALQTSPDPANGNASVTLTAAHSPTQVVVGNDVIYNVTVANSGPDPANGVRLAHALPPNSQFVSATPSQGSCAHTDGRVVCKLGSINASADATVAVTATLTDEGLVLPPEGKTVNSTITARADEDDLNFDDNTITEAVTLLPNPNAAPTISITSPVNGDLFVGPANITFTLTASDSDGTVSSVEVFDGDASIGLASSSGGNQYSLSWTGASFGKHTLQAIATDNNGRQGKSDPLNIIVNGSVNISWVDPTAYREYSTTAPSTIVADASLSGGTITKVDFYANGEWIGLGTLISANRYSCNWVHPYTGNYSLEAVATDNSGITTTSRPVDVSVKFNTAPTVTITTPPTGSAFATPANIALIANATDNDGWISAVDFYANGSKIGAGARSGSQFTFTWSNPPSGSYSLTAIAVDDTAESTTSAPINISVSSPPSVSITAPANGSQYAAPATIPISATASDSDGSIARVDFYSNGGLLGSGTFSGGQYNYSWANVAPGNYTLTAKAIDNSGVVTTSSGVSITVNSAALFVVGSTTLTASDAAVKARLEALNNTVTVKTGTAATTADATGKALVVISSTVTPASVGTKFRTVTVPVMTWESGLFTNMGMTGSSNKDFGTKTNQTQLTITNASHPLAAGLSGNVSVVSSGKTFDWGKPNANAISVAAILNDAAKTAIFGYETGAVMPGLTAPARRLGFFMFDDTAVSLNANGIALLDAAIRWTRGGGSISASLSTSPPSSVDLTTEGLADWAHWGLTGPTAFNHKGSITQQISNVTNIGTGTVGWFADSSTTCSWTDGTPTLTASNTPNGINVNGAVGNGFEITVPADTNLRTLKLYLGVWYAQGKLEASLSDGSAPTYVNTGLNNNGGGTFGFYTINFKAGSAAQTVKVRFTMLNQYFPPNGNLAWRAATLQ